jgi:hypothetical protein
MAPKSAPLSQNHLCVRGTHRAGSLLTFVPMSLGPPARELHWGCVGGANRDLAGKEGDGLRLRRWTCRGGGGGGLRSVCREKSHLRIALGWASVGKQLPSQAEHRSWGLREPCSLDRLVHVPAFAAHGSGNFCRSHPFFAQGDNARAVERDGAALVNALRLCGVDAGALPITNEAKLLTAMRTSPGRMKSRIEAGSSGPFREAPETVWCG